MSLIHKDYKDIISLILADYSRALRSSQEVFAKCRSNQVQAPRPDLVSIMTTQ